MIEKYIDLNNLYTILHKEIKDQECLSLALIAIDGTDKPVIPVELLGKCSRCSHKYAKAHDVLYNLELFCFGHGQIEKIQQIIDEMPDVNVVPVNAICGCKMWKQGDNMPTGKLTHLSLFSGI